MYPITSTIPPPNISCAEIAVNCSLLEKFHYNETLRQTQDILTFNTSSILLTRLSSDERVLLQHLNDSNEFGQRFNQKGNKHIP